jgi:UDP:flavonoid glycosyltransferase YjiC (YdhE family)
MRMLFTSAGGRGHSDPLLPIARAARRAGHDVAFCCRPPMAPALEADGFPAFTAGPAIVVPTAITPLVPLDLERELGVLRDGFAGRGIARQRAIELPDIVTAWQPDVFVSDETDFGALVVAERRDLPYATVVVSAAGSFLRPDVMADPLQVLRAKNGLGPDPELAMLTRYCVLAPVPPGFRDPAFPLSGTGHPIRPAVLDDEPGDPPAWLAGDAQIVYFTLGSVFGLESGDLFGRVLRGLGDLPVDVVATVGTAIDAASLGSQPANVRVEQFVPQRVLLPRCRAVVSHGGSGTVVGALAFGAPQVLLPLGADQPWNAARCDALGVGRVLDPLACSSAEVHDAVALVMHDPGYRERATRQREEALALPDATHAVTLLERLATEREPILRRA